MGDNKATKPCPCGYLGEARCRCTPAMVNRYLQRVSGPLLDRIDLQLHVARPALSHLQGDEASSEKWLTSLVARRVADARARQQARSGCLNSALAARRLGETAAPDAAAAELLRAAGRRFGLSARGYHRVLRVARTIADLAGDASLTQGHVAEALGWRVALTERWLPEAGEGEGAISQAERPRGAVRSVPEPWRD